MLRKKEEIILIILGYNEFTKRVYRKVMNKSFLSEDEKPAFTLIKNDSPVIFSGPHNGIAVPKCLPACLGMDENWFLAAHESHDLHVAELFDVLRKTLPEANYIMGNYSRLVTDLNRVADNSIASNSSEYEDEIQIKGNLNLSGQEINDRVESIYLPYHDALADLIEERRQKKHGGVIKLDIHSFSPIWKGTRDRDHVEISTIRCESTPYSLAFEEFIKRDDAPYIFKSGRPYKLTEHLENAAHDVQKRNQIQYLGIEIRSDLIDTIEKQQKMASYLASAMDYVLSRTNIEEIMAPWIKKPNCNKPEQSILEPYMQI